MSESRGQRVARVALLIVFGLVMASDAWQVIDSVALGGGELASLVAWHAVGLVLGASAFAGILRRARWAPWAVAAWGLSTGAMVASLPALLGLAPDERGGIWIGAASILAFAVLSARLVRPRVRAT